MFAHQIDTHMGVLHVGKAQAQHDENGVQVPFRLLQLGRPDVHEPSGDHIEYDDYGEAQQGERSDPPEAVEKSIDSAAERK